MPSFENIRLVIADPSPLVRSGLKAALFSKGFRAITDLSNYKKLHDLLAADAIDLLVAAAELEDNDVGFLVREMRNGRLGSNPFVVVVTMSVNSDPDTVRRIIDAGVDDILLTPIAPDQLMPRIDKLTHARKPFVVTHDYTGPDRRAKNRDFPGMMAQQVEVPNPLKSRLADGMDGTRLKRAIDDAAARLNRLKIERHAAQISWLVTHVQASVRDGVAKLEEMAEFTHRLVVVTEDMHKRARGTPAEAAMEMVGQVHTIAQRLAHEPESVIFTELEQLAELAKNIARRIGGSALLTTG